MQQAHLNIYLGGLFKPLAAERRLSWVYNLNPAYHHVLPGSEVSIKTGTVPAEVMASI
jgi:hypothetical protein